MLLTNVGGGHAYLETLELPHLTWQHVPPTCALGLQQACTGGAGQGGHVSVADTWDTWVRVTRTRHVSSSSFILRLW